MFEDGCDAQLSLEKWPSVAAYVKRVSARPAYEVTLVQGINSVLCKCSRIGDVGPAGPHACAPCRFDTLTTCFVWT